MPYSMVFLLLLLLVIISLYLGKTIFHRFFNPISVYVIIWGGLIFFYELRLINYVELTSQTWFVIIGSYFCFLFGILLGYFYLGQVEYTSNNQNSYLLGFLEKSEKTLISLSLFFTVVGLLGAIQHWMVLLVKFNTIPEVLVNLSKVYKMRTSGEMEGVFPYISVATYLAIFFVAILTAYKGKYSVLATLPFLTTVIKGIAMVGRQSILYGFLEFVTIYIICRFYFKGIVEKAKKRSYSSIILNTTFIVLLVFSVLLIRDFRGTDETFSGETRQLQSMKGSSIITPSIYLYLSGHLGVLNQYYVKQVEENRFGENTFQLVYNILSKFNVTEPSIIYQRAYYVPEWVNTGTYLRELDADFGTLGVFLVPFIIGFFVFYNWLEFFKHGRPHHLVFLVHLFLIIWFSFLMMITRGANWFISIGILIIVFYLLEFRNAKKTVKT